MKEIDASSLFAEGEMVTARVLRNRVNFSRQKARLSASSSLEDYRFLLSLMESIAPKPLMRATAEDTLIRSEISSHLSPEAFLLTLRDSSLWRNKEGYGMAPELVHAIRYEDNIHLYENLLVVAAIRLLRKDLEKALKGEEKKRDSIESIYQRQEAVFGNRSFFTDISEHNAKIGRGLTSKITLSKEEETLRKLLRRLNTIRRSSFYLTLRKDHLPNRFIPTNILLHHPLYRPIYSFYLNHQDTGKLSPLIRDIRFLLALEHLLKAKLRMKSTMMLSYEDKQLKMENFSFTRNGVLIEVSLKEEVLLFSCSYKGFTKTHKIYLNGEEMPSSYCLVLEGSGGEANTLFLKGEKEMEGQLLSFLNSCSTLIPFHEETLKVCPVCGHILSPLPQGEEATCHHCQSSFAYLNTQGKAGEIWVKSYWGR